MLTQAIQEQTGLVSREVQVLFPKGPAVDHSSALLGGEEKFERGDDSCLSPPC